MYAAIGFLRRTAKMLTVRFEKPENTDKTITGELGRKARRTKKLTSIGTQRRGLGRNTRSNLGWELVIGCLNGF